MAFTEFYCDAANGSNINAGDLTANGVVTSTNGDWGNAAANRFTAASGTPFSGVSVGDFASVYLDGATVGVYVARVTAVNGGGASLDLSATAKSGTAPTTGATGRSCTTGGAWKGPNAAEDFPFDFVEATLTNAAGDAPRVNLKNNATYNVTAAVLHADNGPIRFQGYSSTVGDGGMATIDGGTSGASYAILSISGLNIDVVDIIFQNNGATGNASGFAISGAEALVQRCVVNNVRGYGFATSAAGLVTYVECEAYSCNQANTASFGGFRTLATVALFRRCISHDNSGSNNSGFILAGISILDSCIAESNGAHGFNFVSSAGAVLMNCDAYNNAGSGIELANTGASPLYIENCNLIKNGTGGTGWGINGSGAGARNGAVVNCAFGAGTQANNNGTTTGLKSMTESGSVTYASNVTPWVDPDNGDFRISLAAAINAGRGEFTQTAASYAGTISYPDIGAGQHLEATGLKNPIISAHGGLIIRGA